MRVPKENRVAGPGEGVSIWMANKAMELMGAYGYCFDHHVEKYLRDVKIAQLWLGGPHRALVDSALGCYTFEW